MQRISVLLLSVFVLTASTLRVHATIELPRIIGNSMVLQCNQEVPVWGNAAPGESVTVLFAKQRKQTIADSAGKWKVILKAMRPSWKGQQMIIRGSNTIILEDILVGEVWLCSGQSNMEYAMRKLVKVKAPADSSSYPKDEVESANNTAIRIFLVNRKTLIKPNPAHLDWSIAKDSALRSFSVAGYFFAKEINRQLNVPVGIIESAVPGSRIEPWIPGNIKSDGEPGKFYDPMIAPLAPFALKGFLWYQGESNCFLKDSVQYTGKMEALIRNWRNAWSNGKLPFYYVQIAPFFYSKSKGKVVLDEESEAVFRESQAQAMAIPYTGMVVTTDLNDDLNDLHPSYKWEIGKRLSLWALAKTYGKKGIVYSGPVYEGMKIKDSTIELSFSQTGSGLVSKDAQALTWFSIAGTDNSYVQATAVIKKNKVIVSAPGVLTPVSVKFGWNEAAQSNLYNKEGLPALPFKTADNIKWMPSNK